MEAFIFVVAIVAAALLVAGNILAVSENRTEERLAMTFFLTGVVLLVIIAVLGYYQVVVK